MSKGHSLPYSLHTVMTNYLCRTFFEAKINTDQWCFQEFSGMVGGWGVGVFNLKLLEAISNYLRAAKIHYNTIAVTFEVFFN